MLSCDWVAFECFSFHKHIEKDVTQIFNTGIELNYLCLKEITLNFIEIPYFSRSY